MWKRRNKSRQPIQTIKQQWVSCFGILYLSFAVGLVVELIINLPLGLIVGHTGSLLQDILCAAAVLIALFVLSYRDGRQNYQFKLGRLLIALLLTLVTQVVLVTVFGHAVWFSGPTVSFAFRALDIYNPISVPSKTVLEMYKWGFMLAAFVIVYTPLMILGEYLGARKHKKEFNHEDENTSSVTAEP